MSPVKGQRVSSVCFVVTGLTCVYIDRHIRANTMQTYKRKLRNCILHIWVLYLHVCLQTTYMSGTPRGWKRTSNPLDRTGVSGEPPWG